MKNINLIFSALIFLFIYSCSENGTESDNISESEEQAAIQQVLDADDLIYEEVGDGDEDSYGVDDPSWLGGGFAKDGVRARFGRRISGREGNVEIILTSDTTATAYISRQFKGKFVSLTGAQTSDTSWSLNRFEKPLAHNVERVVNLKKYRDDAEIDRRNWKIESISMADGKSDPTTVSIVELIIYAEGQDSVVITNPTAYFQNGLNMFTFPRFTEVTVKVIVENTTANAIEWPSGSGSTENVRLHYGRNRQGHRAIKKFEYMGERSGYQVYQGTWTIQQFRGIHHAIIDVIDNGTILNDDEVAYPYSSATWGTPYVVTPF
ncbi:MAG: hypothetical protein D8M58_15290 [Calditrichaeota bacterium]|nr:MAG: hypothetical protein DWQ03_16530 [Calditrichota bacterium]MBL1206767.1 hypothetical protein [Calditrichota bacterium]NOG46593.1 hypothetical protein [Calditrichota bacterium]